MAGGQHKIRTVLKVPALGRLRSSALGEQSTDSREAQRHSPKVRPPINLLVGVNFRKNMHSLFSKARVNGYIKFF